MTKTTTAKAKTTRKAKTTTSKTTTAKAKAPRTKGKARTTEPTDAEILAALDDVATETSAEVLGDAATVATVDKAAVYAEQDSTLGVDDTEKTVATKGRRKRKSADGKTVRAKREINMERLAEIYSDPNAIVAKIDELPKKVQDKARNALQAMSSGARLSQYTQYAVEALKASEDGTVEVGAIREMLEGRSYSTGTASAQAQQQMALLPFLGIAERSGRTLKLVDAEPVKALVATS